MKEIVIKISDTLYQSLTSDNGVSIPEILELQIAAMNGTVLPEHHGKLIDISKLDNDRIESDNPIIYLTMNSEYIEAVSLDYLNNLPTIIEAKEE